MLSARLRDCQAPSPGFAEGHGSCEIRFGPAVVLVVEELVGRWTPRAPLQYLLADKALVVIEFESNPTLSKNHWQIVRDTNPAGPHATQGGTII